MNETGGGDQKWLPILAAVVISFLLAGLIFLFAVRPRGTPVVIFTQEPMQDLRFGVYGAVQTPGLYIWENELRVETAVALAGGLTDQADIAGSHLSAWVSDGDTIIIPTMAAFQSTLTLPAQEDLIDLNTADAETLMRLPGIGEKKAADIIALRDKKHGYTSLEELLEIPGISESIFNKIYDRLILSQPQGTE